MEPNYHWYSILDTALLIFEENDFFSILINFQFKFFVSIISVFTSWYLITPKPCLISLSLSLWTKIADSLNLKKKSIFGYQRLPLRDQIFPYGNVFYNTKIQMGKTELRGYDSVKNSNELIKYNSLIELVPC